MKGYNLKECIDFNEIYAHVALLELIRMLLTFSCIMNFKIFKMDVKSAFLMVTSKRKFLFINLPDL